MTTAILERPTPSAKDDMSKPKTTTIRLPEDLVEQIRLVAALRGDRMDEMIGGILWPVLRDMERESLTKRMQSIGPPPKPKRPKGTD